MAYIQGMIQRTLQNQIELELSQQAGIVLLGPRQVGKTTLARGIEKKTDSIYLDLERFADRVILSEPDLFLSEHTGRLVIIDEVQRLPELFASLRGHIDRQRQIGHRFKQFLLLGSASRTLLSQTSESLAGRVSYLELAPLSHAETDRDSLSQLWIRGGFPESFLAPSDNVSLKWRIDFIRTYLERDIPSLGPRVPAETLLRLWTMLANWQGGLLNAARLAASLNISGQSVARYLDLFVDLMLVRRLLPWRTNPGKRLIKSPKVYIRDSGITHALLGLAGIENVLRHHVAGGSWEGFCIENLITSAPNFAMASFYRTSAGAEIDLVFELPNQEIWTFEIKRSTTPRVSTGFRTASEELGASRKILVYSDNRHIPMSGGIVAMPLIDAMNCLSELS